MPIHNVTGVAESDGEVNKVLPAGTYDAEVISAEWIEVKKEGSDYKGATMLKVGIKAASEDGEVAVTCTDVVMLPFPSAMDADQIRRSLAKLKEIQIALNCEHQGDEINEEEFVHQECRVELYIQPPKDGYPESNKVRSYMAR